LVPVSSLSLVFLHADFVPIETTEFQRCIGIAVGGFNEELVGYS
jgi:hypothetical protein